MKLQVLRRVFVERIYGDHNRSRIVRQRLSSVLSSLGPEQLGLNVGAGLSKLHPRIVNVDVEAGVEIQCQSSAMALPFRDGSFDVVITQETLEHVADPFKAMDEMVRVLRSGGVLYCQLPFIIGFHPGPKDFWRFTVQGISEIVARAGLHHAVPIISVGGATGFYRISVEFVSGLVSLGWRPLYIPLKATCALLLFPLKWLDFLFALSPERDRIAGGYLVIAWKP